MKIKLAILSSLLILNLSNAQKFSDHVNDKNTAISISDTIIEYAFNLKGIFPKVDFVMRVSVTGVSRQAIKPDDIGSFKIDARIASTHLDFENIPLSDCVKVLAYLRRVKKWYAIARREFGPNIEINKTANPPRFGVPYRDFRQRYTNDNKVLAHISYKSEAQVDEAIELFEYLSSNSKDIEAHLLNESNKLNEKYKMLK